MTSCSKSNKAMIFSVIDGCMAAAENYGGMLEVPVHCDYHPGNLKYKNEKGVGLFDFDWAKIDYRVFDVALGLVYFTSEWNGAAAGSLRMDKFALFLKNYNEQCIRLDGIAPLTKKEQENLIPMLAAGNLFVLNWDLMDFYETENHGDDDRILHLYRAQYPFNALDRGPYKRNCCRYQPIFMPKGISIFTPRFFEATCGLKPSNQRNYK